jgi:hypothetical protein
LRYQNLCARILYSFVIPVGRLARIERLTAYPLNDTDPSLKGLRIVKGPIKYLSADIESVRTPVKFANATATAATVPL